MANALLLFRLESPSPTVVLLTPPKVGNAYAKHPLLNTSSQHRVKSSHLEGARNGGPVDFVGLDSENSVLLFRLPHALPMDLTLTCNMINTPILESTNK